MVFYTVIMGMIDLSVSQMQIGQNLMKIKGPLRVTVCLLEGIQSHGRVRNKVLSLDLLHARLCGSINF